MRALAITGMHRSGTSMVARSLCLAGVYLGHDADLVPPAPDNPEGFFEHAGFVRMGEDLLEATSGAWDQPPACPPMAADDARVVHLRERAVELIEELAIAQTWGWKDPRTCLTLRFWADLLPELDVIVCLRDPLEVAMSLQRRNRSSYAHALSLWHGYYASLVEAVPQDRRIVTHFDEHFRDPASEVARLVAFAGSPESAVADAATAQLPQLRHHRVELTLRDAGVSSETVELYERLCDEAGHAPAQGPPVSAPARVDRAVVELAFAGQQLERRARQVASLERARTELADRVAELEAAGHPAMLETIVTRLEAVEDAVRDQRYASEQLSGRRDASVVQRCRAMVRAHVARSDRVLVVAKGDPALLDLYGRPTANFPQDETGSYPGFPFAHGVAAIAHLEAQRVRGAGYLLIPATAAWWTERFPDFAAHLATHYDVVEDDPLAGLLVDIRNRRVRAAEPAPTIPDAIDRIASDLGRQPAVLDWTGLSLRDHLPGRTVFEPPPGATLPYLDHTIDVVVIADPARGDEARRAAALAVVVVAPSSRPVVTAVEPIADEPSSRGDRPVRFLVGTPDPDPDWLARLDEALEDERACDVILAPVGVADAAAEADIVAILEEGVVPLPGCCDAVRATFAVREAVGAVAVKLLAADGSLEAAGATVFADGTWSGVASGSHQVAAPWHDYVRGTCGGPGILFLAGAAVHDVSGDLAADPVAWAGGVWGAGRRVLYQPDAAAVRTCAPPSPPATAPGAVTRAWAPVLTARPARPGLLDDPAWRRVLTGDDIEGSWS